MKKKFLYKSTLVLSVAALLTTTACQDFLDVNKDPSNPEVGQGQPVSVFPAAVASTAGTAGAQYAILGGIWSQYWTQSATANQFKDIDAYNLTASSLNNTFDEVYSGALNDYQFVIKKSEASGDWFYFLAGTVMKAYTLQIMADLYDKVPYSEAFQGLDNLTPKYDDGDKVYAGLIAELDNALSKDFTAATNSTPGTRDIVFGGKVDSWKRFANTLKLKMYLRMINAKPTEALAGIQKLYTDNVGFLTTDAAMGAGNFQDAPDKSNPLYEYNNRRLNTTTNLRASTTFMSWLKANNDPRIASVYKFGTGATTYSSLDQGDFNNLQSTAVRNAISIANTTPLAPVHFISTAESYFLQAEAIERLTPGAATAKAAYDAGVKAAFAQYSLDGSSFIAAGGKYEYPVAGSFEQKLEAIITQKWASMAGSHALEAYFEKNRTGYPKTSTVYSNNVAYIPGQFVYPKEGVTQGLFAKRLIFSDRDRQRNPNVPAMVSLTTKVWWDVK
ncbi:SusD/RagB family nutrient-binding outer membrane lipoprotein [Solitalea sp. MAHUQ-68]|uniref:SusD/RagB family nutrient-binding outer membrane lipoprotein n=1 Tax=Solitalea agri TaxID=2953739 RepID=A0A9X2F6G4_9SPHI|nr:SusD/RagB family nutrient-binding outer membrane lipoprotein [Solitalea agri]MCO4293266.1 SusD/RagB family nutrient-binding outer membrane lipoprotein [Solitalea agri]